MPFLNLTTWSPALISSITKLAYSGRSALFCRQSPGLNRNAFSLIVAPAMRLCSAILACTVFAAVRISSTRTKHLVEVVLLDDGRDLNFLDQRLAISLKRRQPVNQIVRIAVRGGIAQGEERIERCQRTDAAFAFHVLRLVQDQHGPCGLHQEQAASLPAAGRCSGG